MQIVQDQPVTGDPTKRTSRKEIGPVFEAEVRVEVRCAADASESEKWGPPDRTFPVWPVQLVALEDVVGAVEMMDTERDKEQAGGSDEEGGTMTALFNDTVIKLGDLNRSNFKRKTSGLRDPRDGAELPAHGTKVGPAVEYLDALYLGEFAKNEETGLWVPVAQRPWMATAIFTDGAMADYREFVARLEMDRKKCAYLNRLEEEFQGLWPGEKYFVAILGEGEEHDATVNLYKDIAKDFPDVHPYDFAGVRNGHEIGEDVSLAMLNRK